LSAAGALDLGGDLGSAVIRAAAIAGATIIVATTWLAAPRPIDAAVASPDAAATAAAPAAAGSPPPSATVSASTAVPPISAFVDTSVVGFFREPSGRLDHDNWRLCGAGALRILLAFLGNNPNWQTTFQRDPVAYGGGVDEFHNWPAMTYHDSFSGPTRQPVKFPGGPDVMGQGYMQYLAYSVHPPTWPTGRSGSWDGKGEPIADMVDVANWEYAGETGPGGGPFSRGSPRTPFATFNSDVERQIAFARAPVVVSVMTGSFPPAGDGSVGLPSWKAKTCTEWQGKGAAKKCVGIWVAYQDLPHWMAIVGYDADNFYYAATCWPGPENCRYGPIPHEVNYPGSTHPYTWRVDKATLYWEMTRLPNGGYLEYAGPPSVRETGY
jgi:hypothetical protein